MNNIEENQNLQNEPNYKFGKSKKRNIIVIITLIVMIIVGGLLYLDYKNKQLVVDSDTDFYTYYSENIFPISEYRKINSDYKKCIIDVFSQNKYLEGDYFFTKVPSRAKKVIAYGNFSDKEYSDHKDIAFLIEKNDFKSSRIFIMSSECLLLYSKIYEEELPTIISFKKGQKIYLEEVKLVPSPSDGIMMHFKNHKTALLYIPTSKTFEEFTQYSDEDIKNIESEGDYESEESELNTEETGTIKNIIAIDSMK